MIVPDYIQMDIADEKSSEKWKQYEDAVLDLPKTATPEKEKKENLKTMKEKVEEKKVGIVEEESDEVGIPLDQVPATRRLGTAFQFQVAITFDGSAPIGIHWDVTSKGSRVDSIEPNSRAAKWGVLASHDQLVQINDVNVADMPLHEMFIVFKDAELPRLLTFSVAATKEEVDGDVSLAPLLLTCHYPLLLANVTFNVAHATWSAPPLPCAVQWMHLATPNTACSNIDPVEDADEKTLWGASSASHPSSWMVALRGDCTFPEKAKITENANHAALLLINNADDGAHFPFVAEGQVTGIDIPVYMYVGVCIDI